MGYLLNKKVIIISPVKWGKMRVSKHQYALAFAKQSAKVYFVEPPDINNPYGVSLKAVDENERLFIISYRPIARGRRFLPYFVFRLFQKKQVQMLLQKLGKPDIVVSFYPYMFDNLRWFKAPVSIFFAVDLVNKELPGEVLTADICFCVSGTIRSQLSKWNRNIHVINHGLNDAFVSYGSRQLDLLQEIRTSQDYKILTIGYFGNLMIGALDRKAMKQVIERHRDKHFVFWGQYEPQQDNMVAFESEEVWQFIEFLQQSPNVHLAGPKDPKELVIDVKVVDIFWLCYNNNFSAQVDGSNSHKILEYLATGKPVIASYISAYAKSDLLYMLPDHDNSRYSWFFEDSLVKVRCEGSELAKKRITFALANSYDQHLNTILTLIRNTNELQNQLI